MFSHPILTIEMDSYKSKSEPKYMGRGRMQKKKKSSNLLFPVPMLLAMWPCGALLPCLWPQPCDLLSPMECYRVRYCLCFPLGRCYEKGMPRSPKWSQENMGNMWSRATHIHDRASRTTDARAIPAGTSLDQQNLADKSEKKCLLLNAMSLGVVCYSALLWQWVTDTEHITEVQ